MSNLSDKELDRLSREAADQYDPVSPPGNGSWNKLEIHLDRELGRIRPNFFRAIRRMPFYYAPALLLLIGVSVYVVKQGKSHPGSLPANAPQLSRTEPTASPPASSLPPAAAGSATGKSNSPNPNQHYSTISTPASTDTGTTILPRTPNGSPTIAAPLPAPGANPAPAPRATAGPRSKQPPPAATGFPDAASGSQNTSASWSHRSSREHSAGTRPRTGSAVTGTGRNKPGSAVASAAGNTQDNSAQASAASESDLSSISGINAASRNRKAAGKTAGADRSDPSWARIQAPGSLTRHSSVDDSALRHYALQSDPIRRPSPVRKINRTLQFGLMVAPDFTSVHSLAGDKPGSSFGLTVDYQVANHWYIGTGLLFSRKNYTARPSDYHVPMDFYRLYNMRKVSLVKGSFDMLEIPLNLRYDFSVVNNTIFFVNAGLSSYIHCSENSSYFFDWYGLPATREFHYASYPNYFFSTLNLSVGVETGLTNSLSMLLAPYVKIPVGGSGMGFGQVRMSSVGLNFALRFAPVLNSKRQH